MTVTFSRLGALGRLGNQLFQISGSLAVARRLGVALSLPPWPYAPFFSVPDTVFGGAVGEEADTFAAHLGGAAPYLQDHELVYSVETTIREWLAPSERSRSLTSSHAGHRTAVHVRRTDYLDLADYYVVPDVDWYVRAVGDATNVHVYSDDREWCRRSLPGDWSVESAEEMHDFWGIATAETVVAANSSFSWWAAFLSPDPHPTVPARWYGPAYAHLSVDRLVPPHWRRVP